MDPATLPQVPAQQRKITGRTKLALWLMIGPTALLIVTFAGYAAVNLAFSGTVDESPIKVVLNVLLFLVGVISVVAGLPGLITGIVLLATPKKQA